MNEKLMLFIDKKENVLSGQSQNSSNKECTRNCV